MKNKSFVLMFLFVLPLFLVGGVNENDIIADDSRSPSSSSSGGVGKEWEIEMEDEYEFKRLSVTNESIYVLEYSSNYDSIYLRKLNLSGGLIWKKEFFPNKERRVSSFSVLQENIYIEGSQDEEN